MAVRWERAAAAALLVCLAGAAQALDPAAVAKLADDDNDAKIEAIGALVAEGDPAAIGVLQRFAEGEVEKAMGSALGPGPFDLLVDIGTGTGRMLELFATRYARGIGLDINQAMLAYARAKLARAGIANAQVRHGDLYSLPLADGAADAVVMHQVLHYLSDGPRAIREAARVLAPGGRLHVIEPNGRNPLVGLHARMIPAEAALRRSAPVSLNALIGRFPLRAVRVVTAQPLPLSRLVLHYRFGLPALGRVPAARRALAVVEAAAGRLLPRSRWAYVAITADRA